MIRAKLTPEQEEQALKFASKPLMPCPESCGFCHPTAATRKIERRKNK